MEIEVKVNEEDTRVNMLKKIKISGIKNFYYKNSNEINIKSFYHVACRQCLYMFSCRNVSRIIKNLYKRRELCKREKFLMGYSFSCR